jgi:xanthine dehydrogenase iron-sulfur cluster and FAD-binding subunit A
MTGEEGCDDGGCGVCVALAGRNRTALHEISSSEINARPGEAQ